jgi:hypothetical protein
MKNHINDTLLSSYLDGELDPEQTHALSQELQRNSQARDTLLSLLHVQTIMKANSLSQERQFRDQNINVPVFDHETQHQTTSSKKFFPLLAAAAFILSLGFGLGLNSNNLLTDSPQRFTMTNQDFFANHPVIQTSLENDKSGTTRHWQDTNTETIIKVTPIKTYQDNNGVFHRLYNLNLSTSNSHESITALAYRSGHKKWRTQSIRFHNISNNI